MADVQVIWRSDRDLALATPDSPTPPASVCQRCRPSTLESVTVPLPAFKRWLEGQQAEPFGDVEGELEDDSAPRRRTGADVRVFRWRGVDSNASTWISLAEIRPGDVLVLEAKVGGLADGSFDPTAKRAALDLGDLAQLRGRGLATLRLHREALAVWNLPESLLAKLPLPVRDDPDTERDQVEQWIESLPAEPRSPLVSAKEWEALLAALKRRRGRTIGVVRGHASADIYLSVVAKTKLAAEVEDAVTEDDDSSFRSKAILLADHSKDVRDFVKRYVDTLGFDREVSSDLALAGWLHDVGKADPRFQRWLVGGSALGSETSTAELLAKSALPPGNPTERRQARKRAGYPADVRHEMLSLAMVEHHDVLRSAHDPELVLHLIASHHGWCRPFPPPVIDPDSIEVRLQHEQATLGARTDHALARLDSGVASRFWRLVGRYGWWGLAWLEAVMRLADHRASEQAEAS